MVASTFEDQNGHTVSYRQLGNTNESTNFVDVSNTPTLHSYGSIVVTKPDIIYGKESCGTTTPTPRFVIFISDRALYFWIFED